MSAHTCLQSRTSWFFLQVSTCLLQQAVALCLFLYCLLSIHVFCVLLVVLLHSFRGWSKAFCLPHFVKSFPAYSVLQNNTISIFIVLLLYWVSYLFPHLTSLFLPLGTARFLYQVRLWGFCDYILNWLVEGLFANYIQLFQSFAAELRLTLQIFFSEGDTCQCFLGTRYRQCLGEWVFFTCSASKHSVLLLLRLGELVHAVVLKVFVNCSRASVGCHRRLNRRFAQGKHCSAALYVSFKLSQFSKWWLYFCKISFKPCLGSLFRFVMHPLVNHLTATQA